VAQLSWVMHAEGPLWITRPPFARVTDGCSEDRTSPELSLALQLCVRWYHVGCLKACKVTSRVASDVAVLIHRAGRLRSRGVAEAGAVKRRMWRHHQRSTVATAMASEETESSSGEAVLAVK